MNAVCCDIIKDTFPFPSNSVSVVFVNLHLSISMLINFPFISEVQSPQARRKSYFHDARLGYKYTKLYTVFSHVTPYTSKSLKHLLMMYNFSDVHVHKLIQLPSTWDNKFMLYLSKFLKYTFPRGLHKWIR